MMTPEQKLFEYLTEAHEHDAMPETWEDFKKDYELYCEARHWTDALPTGIAPDLYGLMEFYQQRT